MRFITNIDFGLDIKDCIGVFASDDALMNIIVNKYEGRCHRGLYIEKILRIRAQSDCVINQYGSPSFGSMSIICEISAIKYARDEIINGCTIIDKGKNGIMICTQGYNRIMLYTHDKFDSVVNGQIISVQVVAARYTPDATTIAINAYAYLPSRKFDVYLLQPYKRSELHNDVLGRIINEEALAAPLRGTTAWKFYEKILHPYSALDVKLSTGVTEINIIDTAETNTAMYVARDPKMNLSRPFMYKYPGIPDGVTPITNVPSEAVMLEMLENYCAQLRTIREYIENYPNEVFTKHKNLWMIYEKNKVQ